MTHHPYPLWFRILFCLIMLCLCAVLAYTAVARETLLFQIQDLSLSLETSRQRETKQQYEYNQVVEALPKLQAELAEVAPKAETAAATVDELKATRKALRADNKALEEAITALTQERDDLLAQKEAFLQEEGQH